MKTSARNIVDAAVAAVLAVILLCLLSCTKHNRRMDTCTGLDVQLLDEYRFVSPEDIERFLKHRYGDYIGQRLDSIRLDRIEEMLESKSVVMESEAWTTDDGMLHVSIVQRAPAVRFRRGEKGFYIDRTGYAFPLHSSYTAEVPLVEGCIPPIENGERADWTAGVLKLADRLASSGQWKDRLASIKVDEGGEITLSMTERKERFIIGQPVDIDAKFRKIDEYLTRILPEKGEGYYRTVNVKYNSQIICRKGI